MDLSIKSFDVGMEIKNKGIEIAVREPNGPHLGDIVVTKSRIIWCKGRTRPENGIKMSWKKFIKTMEAS